MSGGALPSSYPSSPPRIQPTWTAGQVPTPRSMDAPALASLERAGLVGVIAGVVGWGVLAYIEWSGATSASVSMTASGAPHLALSTGTVAAILVLAAIGGLLQMIGLWYYLGAFRALRQADDTFETPSKLVWLALLATPLLLLSLGALLGTLVNLANCINAVPVGASWTASCQSQAAATGGTALAVLLTGILAFIGWLGLLIGVWRCGAHFSASRFRVATVLLLVPFLAVIGSVLLWAEARGLRASRPAPTFVR
ncbi:MAG: DUF973 family protein [Thermoplasmata archaeon]|nr:DUF973 family protein [Thermoplasmata archaeon]